MVARGVCTNDGQLRVWVLSALSSFLTKEPILTSVEVSQMV